jgi:hypothetical protein
VIDPTRDLRFANEPANVLLRVVFAREEPLDRKTLVRDAMRHFEHGAHPTDPEGALDAIFTADDIAGFWELRLPAVDRVKQRDAARHPRTSYRFQVEHGTGFARREST